MPVCGPGHPLALGRDARARLGRAVRELLDAPGLKDAPDPVRLAVLVLAARMPWASGLVEITSGELGRWLGLSASHMRSVVLPGLRRSGVVTTRKLPGEFGEDRILECQVLPLRAARGVVGHPLALSRKELATFLRLMEALMAPGWAHRDGSVTPAGLLGGRTGRGSSTDRLALLMVVLEATETGRVRLCGGTVDTRRGRAAATLARLLGCGLPGAERVLERLEDAGLVKRPRRETASGLNNRGRLVVPAVAAAHRQGAVSAASERRAVASSAVFSDPEDVVRGGEGAAAQEEPQVTAAGETHEAVFEDPDDVAPLHTDHPPVAGVTGDGDALNGFSGGADRGSSRRPERAGAREDQAVDSDAGERLTLVGGEGDPLRGEQPKKSDAAEVDGPVPAAAAAGQQTVVGGGKARQQRGVSLPEDIRLRVALGPVSGLWSRLGNGWQRRRVTQSAQAELALLAGIVGSEAAPQLLADRLTDRLQETGGEAFVRDAVGWLVARGLVQRPVCADRRCDDGVRLDAGDDCPTCGFVIGDRRARRARIAAEVDAELPGADAAERQAVLQERLRRRSALEAEDFEWRRRQAEAEQARREAARAEALARAEARRAAAQAAEAARQAQPCADCGAARSSGLCEACGYRRQTRALVEETVLVAAAGSADVDDPADVAAVTEHVRAELERQIAAAVQQLLDLMSPDEARDDPQQLASGLAFTAKQAMQQAAGEYRSSALSLLARSPEAEMEAGKGYATELRKRRHAWNPDGQIARTAAREVADAARERTARYLLAKRLEQLRAAQGGRTGAATPEVAEAAVPAPRGRWADRLAPLAARPISDDFARTVTA